MLRPDDIDGVVVHATTIVTNALIERKGGRTALICTRGFADVLSIRNEHRYEMYDPQIEFAAPLIPRDLTFESTSAPWPTARSIARSTRRNSPASAEALTARRRGFGRRLPDQQLSQSNQ